MTKEDKKKETLEENKKRLDETIEKMPFGKKVRWELSDWLHKVDDLERRVKELETPKEVRVMKKAIWDEILDDEHYIKNIRVSHGQQGSWRFDIECFTGRGLFKILEKLKKWMQYKGFGSWEEWDWRPDPNERDKGKYTIDNI